MRYWLECMACGAIYPPDEVRYVCDRAIGEPPGPCGGLLDVRHDMEAVGRTVSTSLFESRAGAWHGADASECVAISRARSASL